MDKLLKAYGKHKWSAKKRSIPFLLSFEEWLLVWKKSGHLKNRGRGASNYCMARYEDKGPYTTWNVRIITNADNAAEIVLSVASRQKLSNANRGKKISKASVNKMLKSRKGFSCFYSWGTRLTERQREEIRKRYWIKNETQAALAKEYGVSSGTVSTVVHEKTIRI